MTQYSDNELVFLDETGIHLCMAREYGRSESGKRVYEGKRQHPQKKDKLTWVSALSNTKLFAHFEIKGSMTGAAFLTYVEEILLPELEPNQIVVMDNLACHKTEAVRNAFEKAGQRILFLPPYSPDLNPIKECWSKFKSFLKKEAARAVEALQHATQAALDSISQQDIQGWFRHFRRNIRDI